MMAERVSQGNSILVVEDELIVAEDLKQCLTGMGYQVPATVASGEMALLQVQKEVPDLVLMDIRLDGQMDGIDTASTFKEEYDIPVIYLTSYSDPDTLNRAKPTEPYGYIIKPYQESELRSVIEMALYRHRKEQHHRLTLQHYRTLVEHAPDAIAVIDMDKCEFIDCNKNTLDLLQFNREELFKIKPINLVPPHDMQGNPCREKVLGKVRELINGGQPSFETILLNSSGVEVACDIRLLFLPSEVRNLVRVSVFNVSHLKQQEGRVVERRAHSASVVSFARGLSQKYNNLLTIIMGHVSLTRQALSAGDINWSRLKEAEAALDRARDLTAQLQAFAADGVPLKIPFNLVKVLKRNVQVCLSGTKVNAQFFIPDDLFSVDGDENMISQVINNIIYNAREAMPEGGSIQVYCQNVRLQEEDGMPGGPFVVMTVVDSGRGIPVENMDKVFQPDFTTKEEGRGLGLAVSHSIVHQHGGRMQIKSEPQGGTTVDVYLPALPNVIPLHVAKPARSSDKHVARILILEDDESVGTVMTEILSTIGYETVFVTSCGGALEAYEEARSGNRPMDLAILDLMIQGEVDGKKTLEQLKKINPNIKTILSSAMTNHPIMARYQKYGFDAVLPKPYTPEKLLETILKVLAD